MKKNYKVGEKIIITKPGILNGIEAKVISHNIEPDTIYKPLRVECEGGYTVALEYFEVKSDEKDTQCYDKFEPAKIKSKEATEKPAKRPYTKRGTKPKEVREKRAYRKKEKPV